MPRVRTKPLTYTEAKNEDYFPICDNLDKLNWEFLRRASAFQYDRKLAEQKPPREYIDNEKKKLRRFFDMPDFYPIKLKSESSYDSL